MRRFLAVVILLFAVALWLFAQSNTLKVREELNLGVQAYKQGNYQNATQHFRNAVALDPDLMTAHLYLATAIAQQVIPGESNDDNKHLAQSAIDEFEKVLDAHDPLQRLSALKGIAMLYFNTNQLDKAKEYEQKVTETDPNDPEAYYAVGVIDWTQTYKAAAERKAPLNLKVDDPFTPETMNVCEELRLANQDKVKEGIEMLAKAIELRPDYDDAMAYMNLMYRRRADIQCGDPAARAIDLKKADEWVNLTLATKKKKSEAQRIRVMPPPK